MIKKITLTMLMITISATLFAQHQFSVEVTGLVKGRGYVYLGLYNKKNGFLNENASFANGKVKVAGTVATYIFNDLPAAEYAVAVYQDENNNGKCDRNMIGYPKEAFGFSKNFKPKLSAPKFDEVKVRVDRLTKTSIALIGN